MILLKNMIYIRHRKFTDYVKETFPEWKLINIIKDKLKQHKDKDFYIFKKNEKNFY